MGHDYSTWLGRTHAKHWMRSTTPSATAGQGVQPRGGRRLRSIALGCLLAGGLLAGLPAVACASTTDMRGEWTLVLSGTYGTIKGQALITQETNAKEEFASSSAIFESLDNGTFSGTLEGSKASVRITLQAYGPLPASEFTSSAMTIESSGGSLSMSGSGTATSGALTATDTLIAKRVKTYQEVQEQEEKEKHEREERELRAKVQGEWSLTVKVGSQTSQGTALVTSDANAKNEFASSRALFEGVDPGTFSGILELSKASVEVTTEAYGPLAAGKFTSNTMTIDTTSSSMSMSGSGTLTSGTTTIPGATLLATRIATYTEVTEREAKEKQEHEASEAAERAAKEKQEREASEAAERAAREKLEREAKEKLAREAREAVEKAIPITIPGKSASVPALVSVQLAGKAFTVGAGGSLSLQTMNPNPYAISGRVMLLLASSSGSGKAAAHRSSASNRPTSLGTVSFGIPPGGRQLVKLALSRLGRSEMSHHAVIHVIATITTQATGQTRTVKRFPLTLHAKPASRKA